MAPSLVCRKSGVLSRLPGSLGTNTSLGSCSKAHFDCSYAKKPLKPGPKGPRATTSNRIQKKLYDIRAQAAIAPPPPHVQATPVTATGSSPDGGIDWLGDSPSPASAPLHGPSGITFDDVCTYLRIYRNKMYPVWPVVNAEEVIARLGPEMQDPEVRALAFSVCAATGAQLRLDDFDVKREQNSIIDRFAGEAERYRVVSDARENATINFMLIPFFLSMYYSSRKKRFTATLLLREALTLCELLDLDKEPAYATLDVDEQKWRRKVFWLLFITERGTAMQYDMAIVLRNTVAMPREEDDKDPVIFKAFLSLVHLFVAVEGTLIGGGQRGEAGPASTPELFAEMQEKLRSELQLPANSNEVQRTDITVTQQWLASNFA